MAGKITDMSKIKQVLIMHRQGHSNRSIARMVGMNKCTVNEYIRKIKTDPLGADRLLELDESVLEGRLFAGNPAYTDGRMNTFLTKLAVRQNAGGALSSMKTRSLCR